MPTTYAIPNGRTVMDATLYTGNNGTSRAISNADNGTVGFKPDLVWIKNRNSPDFHTAMDSVRGSSSGNYGILFPNSDIEEYINSVNPAWFTAFGSLNALNSNGFTVTAGSNATGNFNSNAESYVAWQWQAGQGTTSSNTSGSITSTVSVNATAGFSVATFTANGTAGATIGHGLGVAPSMIIVKCRSNSATDWIVYHSSLGATQGIYLDLTNAAATSSAFWNNTAPTSSVFSIGSTGNVNVNGYTNVAYCWAPVAGFSQFGSYTGNGSTDGTFIYTGFRPKYVMWKRSSGVGDWLIQDTSRSPYNVSDSILYANTNDVESNGGGYGIDILSNGFKFRTAATYANANGSTYIYMAFAENPFKYANAR